MRVHLFDGTFELFRAFYGAPEAKGPDGREFGATRGFARQLLNTVRREEATHVAVAFDHTIESFRNGLYDGYKTGEGIDPDLWAQFPLAERMANALGFVVWPMVEFEADDALAAGAAKYSADERVHQVRIVCPDKDLMQSVVAGDVVCVDVVRKREYDEAGVIEKFGVRPASIPDYLALVGDDADGIPGLPGWGAKSSSTVLMEYDHVERIPADVAQWSVKVRGAARLAETLGEQREEALLYRTLATLRRDVPLAEELDDLEWSGPRRGELEALCAEIGETRLPESV